MTYVERNLVPGETLVYQTRHHWIVLLVPLIIGLVLDVAGAALLVWAIDNHDTNGLNVGSYTISLEALAITGGFLLFIGAAILLYGVLKRNATEMAVTNQRVLIKTGMGGRKTVDLMLSRVESIGVEETAFGRVIGFGNVIVRGMGGTPETFEKIAHPQEFRRNVQQQIGAR